MANTIELFKTYVPLLDEVYKKASLTGIIDGAADLARQGVNANELIIPMIEMDGLADYSRNGGYVDGNVTLTNETVKCNFDRGRMFTVDYLDNAETAGLAYGRLAAEFIRTKVVPELDAFRLATYAGAAGISKATAAALTTGEGVVSALRAAANKMDEDEVPEEGRVLFITPSLISMVEDLDTTKSRAVLSRFSTIQRVPQTRMYTKITQGSNGYAKDATNGKNINFLVAHKEAVIQYQKHVAPKVITPEANQTGDSWKFGYRNVGIASLYQNKLAGIYLHASTT